jgi:hypothetical protein
VDIQRLTRPFIKDTNDDNKIDNDDATNDGVYNHFTFKADNDKFIDIEQTIIIEWQ